MTNYEHLRFEDWLLSQEPLSRADAQALQEHLQSCSTCSQLAEAWRGVETELQRAALAVPKPGFSQRWQARWEEEILRKKRRQTLYILFFSIGGALSLLLLLGVLFWPVLRAPLPFLLTIVYQLTGTFYAMNASASLIFELLRTVLAVIPVSLWVGIIVAVSGLAVVWIVSMKKLTSTWRVIS
jgi:anti-sigma factor RsiW